ncbi:MAG: hypothetical protein JWL77_1048 [Chthonomonadaceae bacterium]|nr:hypothetical protein [Chthonomonadaceae bacterium]
MKISGRFVVGPALLVSLLVIGGTAHGRQVPAVEMSTGVEAGKAPVVIAATIVCGPLEKDYYFEPRSYGKVSGDAPIRSSHPPFVLYTSALTPGFFRLATTLDALVAKDPTWANSLVMVSDEKGAQRGGYTVEELTGRRANLRQLVLRNHITHLSFFLSAPPAKTLMSRLKLIGKQDILLAGLDNRTRPSPDAAVLSAQRLVSEELTPAACKKAVDTLISPPH